MPCSVSELTARIKSLLEAGVGRVEVIGEISNFKTYASGHSYFTLKDAGAQISAVIFARAARVEDPAALENGAQVCAVGELSVYPPRGNYQLIVRAIRVSGKGDLAAQFEALKERLAKEGLFDEDHKLPLPVFPQRIGIVTAPNGAAIKDILNVLDRRFPNLDIVLAPVRVQGAEAAPEIAAAIDNFNLRGDRDVLIVGRGGGSKEDLWPFNEEIVARAIYASRIPIISAVGHEIDFSISDFVADMRAPTPSAAAELVIRPKADFLRALESLQNRLSTSAALRFAHAHARLDRAAHSRALTEPRYAVERLMQRLDHISERLRAVRKLRLDSLRARLEKVGGKLEALSPDAVLRRGYSITRDENGRIVRDAAEISAGARIISRLANGEIISRVEK